MTARVNLCQTVRITYLVYPMRATTETACFHNEAFLEATLAATRTRIEEALSKIEAIASIRSEAMSKLGGFDEDVASPILKSLNETMEDLNHFLLMDFQEYRKVLDRLADLRTFGF